MGGILPETGDWRMVSLMSRERDTRPFRAAVKEES